MGNDDGLASAIENFGKNKVINVCKGCYFSFAFGNEIALVLIDEFKEGYYILNCDEKLWEDVKKFVDKIKNKKDEIKIKLAKEYWYDKSKQFEISEWSFNFEELKEEQKK